MTASEIAGPGAPVRGGLLAWMATTDHKRVGVRIAGAAFGFFLLSGVLALVVRSELAAPGRQLVSADTYNQLFTMHGSGMVFLVVTPLALALGVYLVPLQVGAAEIAWPRLTLLGHWLLLAGGVAMYSGFMSDQGAAKAGWTAYYPLSGEQATPGSGMDLWIMGVILAAAGSLLLAASVLITVVRRRAPGMTMLRLPIFTWAMVVSCLMILMSFPVLIAGMGLLLADRHLGEVFDVPGGAIAYQNLFWFYGHPVVYVMFFPFLGAAAEIVATFSHKRYVGYRPTVIALLAFAALSMSVWAHHMFTTGLVPNRYFALTSTLLIVPAGTEYLGALGTMWRGSISLRVPMLFALGFFIQFLIGGLTGVMVAAPVLDYHVHDSYFVVAHFHYTLFAGSLFGLFGAVYFWWPKVTGAMLGEGLGRVHFALMVVGTNLTFFPMFLLGERGMPRRVADYSAATGYQGLNVAATIGAFVIALSVAVFVINVVRSSRHRRPAGDDPWQGHTLEWATSSPPPRHNFTALPPIGSHAPVFDRRHGLGPRAPAPSSDPGDEPARAAAVPLLAAALLLGTTATALWIWGDEALEPALLTGAALTAALTGTLAALGRRRTTGTRRIPDASVPTVLVAAGLAIALGGAAFGLWLTLVGLELLAFGVGGLLVERRAARRRGRR